MQQEHQFNVQDTNQQALASKVSAIKKGYFPDVFAQQFVKFRGKRDIIIHRGYWARVYIVRQVIESMLKSGCQVQIFSLGCGLQTLWYNLANENKMNDKKCLFIELDLPNVVKKKINKIQKSNKIKNLFNQLGQTLKISQNKQLLTYGNSYKLASCDLSDVNQFQKLIKQLGVNNKIPTLFYCQCVLSYIDADRVDQLLSFIGKEFELSFFFDYEMYNPDDRFGQMMMKNFQERGCPLEGVRKYPLLADQNKRFSKAGFKKTEIYTMAQIYYDCIEKSSRLEIEKLQMLDELQEWNIIMSHYFALLSSNWSQNGEKDPNYKIFLENLKLKH